MQLANYLSGETYSLKELESLIEKVQKIDLNELINDKQKMAFWINVYNGLINYRIVKNELRKSIWEKPGFFTETCLSIGEFSFSLDDIEHGVLRKNGERRNGKPRQFDPSDNRLGLMVEQMDFRIHFALNCGSVSCPPIAFYNASKIEQELTLAEDGFSASEFIVNHETKTVDCSSVFIWYRNDFGQAYLNDSELSRYTIKERPYVWEIQ